MYIYIHTDERGADDGPHKRVVERRRVDQGERGRTMAVHTRFRG